MAKPFKSTRRGITGALEPGEARLLGALLEDVISMLEPETEPGDDPLAAIVGMSGADAEATAPDDSAVRRLLPDAVRGDDDEALAFRRLTERSLREQKIGAVIEDLTGQAGPRNVTLYRNGVEYIGQIKLQTGAYLATIQLLERTVSDVFWVIDA